MPTKERFNDLDNPSAVEIEYEAGEDMLRRRKLYSAQPSGDLALTQEVHVPSDVELGHPVGMHRAEDEAGF